MTTRFVTHFFCSISFFWFLASYRPTFLQIYN
nr:MAG TPA: hypothetical protein [Caudoviricetes sp.]